MPKQFKVGDKVRVIESHKVICEAVGFIDDNEVYTVVNVFPYRAVGSDQVQCVDLEGFVRPDISDGRFGAEWFELVKETKELEISGRFMIVFDGEKWFIRRVASSTLNSEKNEMIYHCDKHLGGPFETLDEAVTVTKECF